MPTKDEKKTDAVNPTVSPYALVVELEGALTGGRRTLFDTLKKLLKKEKLNLDEVTFMRHAIVPSPVEAIPELIAALEGDGVSTDKMQAALLEALKSGEAAFTPAPALRKMIETAKKQNVPVVVVSCLPVEAAEAVFQKTGLEELGVQLHVAKSASTSCPGKKDWQEICRTLTRIPRNCFALVGTGAACHTALSVDMRVIAIADEFTAAQDFGGAEAVCETVADFTADDLFARMTA